MQSHQKNQILQIQRQYDPNFDIIPDGPPVTWAERSLAAAVIILIEENEELNRRLKRLEEAKPETAQEAQPADPMERIAAALEKITAIKEAEYY